MQSSLAAPVAAPDLGLHWQAGFSSLGSAFYTELAPTPLPDCRAIAGNPALAQTLGLNPGHLHSDDGVQVWAGNRVPRGASPLASVYSGHQFGVWAGQLGDGRAILLGEVDTPVGPQELQLKGAGRTPYSRMGDGRAVLRSSIREFLASEALHGLGIPTTRALALVGSPAPVYREEVETAAVVTRVAPSFIRFGHFEHFAARGQDAELRALADHVIDRFYPECRATHRFEGNAYAAFLEAVSERTAALLAHWQAVGFCHGVMNTDNMSILGLTIDYGPFQFLDGFDPGHICNHSDSGGRYAYNRQPNVAYWNLYCLAQALLPLIDDEARTLAALESYKTVFPRALEDRMRAKLGLADVREGDRGLIDAILSLLAATRVDYTLFWRSLADWVDGRDAQAARDLFADREAFDGWLAQYAQRLTGADRSQAASAMRRVNPRFVLRNHLGELAIRRAKLGDHDGVAELQHVLAAPFDEHPGHEHLAGLPPDWASQIEISCSS